MNQASSFVVYGSLLILVILWLFSSRDNENVAIKSFFRKLYLYWDSFLYMILSKDGKGVGKLKQQEIHEKDILSSKSKTIIFLRHGESDWNYVFNKGINFSFIGRLFYGLYTEFAALIFTSDSFFVDSPLNVDGIEQALQLRKYLWSEKASQGNNEQLRLLHSVLRGDSEEKSIVVSSTLRRAIATTLLALWPRVNKLREKVRILSTLQEISRNVDTRSISEPRKVADLPFRRVVPHCENFSYDDVFDASENFGNKSRSFIGVKRLQSFAEWCFNTKESYIIVGGHSLWFKSFFQTYLPLSSNHVSKSKKIANTGIVSFVLTEIRSSEGSVQYKIDPDSITTVYGGFETKK